MFNLLLKLLDLLFVFRNWVFLWMSFVVFFIGVMIWYFGLFFGSVIVGIGNIFEYFSCYFNFDFIDGLRYLILML